MIKVTLIGHACLLFQSKETTVLTDPVWFDYLWEEINVLCPNINLDKANIPPVDVLNLSHRHQDHFDVRTLAYLKQNDRILKPDVRILAPKDDVLLDVLNELEFENVEIVSDFETIAINDITLTPTPSLNKVGTAQDEFPEHGLIVSDGDVTIWNQVDTIVNPDIIHYIRQNFGQVDLAHSRFLPLLEGNFSYQKPCNLPFDEYSSFLNVVKALEPKFVVPGSAAFRYRDEFNFLNQYSFPTTQQQFLGDLELFCPGIPSSVFLNGDVAEVTNTGVTIKPQGSDFVKMIEDDSHRVAFKPVLEVTPIRTTTQDTQAYEKEMNTVREFIENEFIEKIRSSDLLDGWKHWQVVYQLEVFGQEGSEIWSIDFGKPEIDIQKRDLNKINLYEGIASSELLSLIEKTSSWDYIALNGNYRAFNNIYRIDQGKFEYYPSDKITVALEPLMDTFPWDREMDREKFMKDVRRWKGVPQE